MLSPPADYNGTMNVLHRRKQQLDNWENSETNQVELVEHEPEKVNFSDSIKFWAACSHRDIPEIKRFLEKKVDVNVAKVDGLTALHQACIDNAYEIVEFLLDNGADPNIQDNEGWTPLHATSSCDYSEIARLLIERNASTGITSYDNELPLDIATNKQMRDILREAMIKQGVDEKEARNYEHTALLNDSKAWLLNPEEYPKITDPKSGATPIHVASAKDYVDVLKILIQIPDIDVNVQDIDGWTPLHAAAHWGQEESVRLLVGAGASFDILTYANQSITDVAVSSLTMIIRQLREQRRLYNLSVGKTETPPDSKGHAVKRKSSEESIDDKKEKRMDDHAAADSANVASDKDELNEPLNDSSNGKENEDVSKTTPANNYEPIHNKADSIDLSTTKKSLLPDLDERVRGKTPKENEIKEQGDKDKLLKDISNVRKDKSLSSASSTSSTSSSSSYTRRVSAVMAPAKAEETETQRSIRARHVRSTRRSTQGITNETLEEARRLTQEDGVGGEIAEADSSTNPANVNDEKKSPEEEVEDAPPMRSWRDRISMNAPTSADSTTDTASTTSSTNSSNNKISLRRQTRDRVPTGKVNQADLDAAKEQNKESSNLSSSRQNSSSDEPVTPTSGRPQTRYTSRYTALNGSSATNSSLPTTTPTSPIGSGYGKVNDSRSTSTHTNSSSGYTSVRNSPSRSGNISALSTSGTPPPQSSWRDSSNLDYRRLYEEERAEKDRLKRQLESLNRQISDLNSELNRLQLQNNFTSDASTRNRSYQTDENFKELTTLREQNARMKEENGALIRVISKLSRPT